MVNSPPSAPSPSSPTTPPPANGAGRVQSRVFSGWANGVLWAEAGVGVLGRYTSRRGCELNGPQALALLRQGKSAPEVVKTVWANHPDTETTRWSKQGRQFAVVDSKGNVAAYTGPKATTYAGDRQGPHVTVQGNILAGPGVVDSMLAAYTRTTGHLAFRLLAALEAGDAAGGDARGKQSAPACSSVWYQDQDRWPTPSSPRGG